MTDHSPRTHRTDPSHDRAARTERARRAALSLLVVAGFLTFPGGASAQDPWTFEEPERVSEGLKDPVDIAFGRDGYLYYASLTRTEVRRVALDTGELDEGFVVELPEAYWDVGSETGVFGLEVHPEFATNGIMYVSYSRNESGEWTNVLSRVTLQDATGAAEEEVLMTRPGGLFHNGGRVLIADGHLWWTSGDASNPFEAPPEEAGKVSQADGDMRGKVMRLTLDGEPAEGNPWGDAAYTKGHRNVYGIGWDPEEGRMLVTENGNARRDYIYVLEHGGNYGWPHCEGACDEPNPDYIDPIWQSEGTVAPTGITWFRGAFWFGTFNQGDLMRLSDHTGEWEAKKVFHHPSDNPRVLDVEVGPEGQSLWFSTWSELWRIDFPEDPEYPPVAAVAEPPFWWNGTETGERAEPPTDGNSTSGTIPGPGPVISAAALGVAMMLVGRRIKR